FEPAAHAHLDKSAADVPTGLSILPPLDILTPLDVPMFEPGYEEDLVPGFVPFEISAHLPENQAVDSTLIGTVGSFQISLDWDAPALAAPQSFRDGMQAAANIIAGAFSDPITVHIKVGYGSINGQPLSSQTSALGGWNSGFGISYSNLRSELAQGITSA